MTGGEVAKVLTRRHVLVVEDQYLVAEEVRRVVMRLGGEVLGPVGAVEVALDLMEERRPDLALLDVNLHGAMVDPLARRLRDMGVPVIFATGYSPGSLSPEFHDAPHLDKPITPATLAAALARHYPELGAA